jgi:hypothetical protein
VSARQQKGQSYHEPGHTWTYLDPKVIGEGASLRVGMIFYLSEGEEWEESYSSMLYQIEMRQCGIICQNLLVMNTMGPHAIGPHTSNFTYRSSIPMK